MKTLLSRRPPVAVAAVLVLALLSLGFLAALGVRSLVAGTASAGPAVPNPGHQWTELENHGTSGSPIDTYYLGTTGNQSLELRVNGARALRLEPATSPTYGFSPNVIGGYSGNSVTAGASGATIGGGGGGGSASPNHVTDDYGTVGGGTNNQAGNGGARRRMLTGTPSAGVSTTPPAAARPPPSPGATTTPPAATGPPSAGAC